MKKILSLLLTLSLLLSMGLAATAATSGQLVDGDNEIELPWDTDEASVYTYTATQTGTLYIAAVDFGCAFGDYNYEDNTENMSEWKMYTSLSVDGQVLPGGYYGSVEVVEGQTYTFSWAHSEEVVHERWYTLGWNAVLNLSYSGDLVPKVGTEVLPVELYLEDCPLESIEVPAGGTVWYMLYYFDQAEFLVMGENAYVEMDIWHMDSLMQEHVRMNAEDGVVTVPITTYCVLIQIGNKGEEPAVFTLNYRYPEGCEKNPDKLVMGENVASLKANNYDGYIYEWTAQCDGLLTLTMPEKNWTLQVFNMTSEEDVRWYDSGGENVITVELKQGEVFWFYVNYMDERNYSFPGGDVIFTADAAYDHNYVDGVCEHCGDKEALYELGDVTGDGRVNTRDARALLLYVAGILTEDDMILEVADVTGDQRVNVRDARQLLLWAVGL